MNAYARIDGNEVAEIILCDETFVPFSDQYAEDVVKRSVQVDAERAPVVNSVYEGGAFYPPRPSPYHSLINGEWVEDYSSRRKDEITTELRTLDGIISREVEDLYQDAGINPSFSARIDAIEKKNKLRAEYKSL